MNYNQQRRNSSFLEGSDRKSGSALHINEGLRAYLMRVYQLMGLGLLVSALTAFLGTTDAIRPLLFAQTPKGLTYTLLSWIIIFAPLILVFMFGSAVRNIDPKKAKAIFWTFSALMGFSFSVLLLAFTAASLFQTFIVAAGSFGALCLYGYSTKRDLTGVGAFMSMGLWGIIIAMIVNWFMQSPAVSYAISIIGVVIFVGLTAFDSQRIKQLYNESDSNELIETKAISGALELYLDFINLFLMLLRFMGDRK